MPAAEGKFLRYSKPTTLGGTSDQGDPEFFVRTYAVKSPPSMPLFPFQAMDRFTSPVFLSLNERGQLEEGLGGVPDHTEGRSILFVGNHQLLGIDMPILVSCI